MTAETQTRGRGRLGRTWVSPPRSGLYLSVLLRPNLPASTAQSLTFLGAVAMARALQRSCRLAVRLKWPNDLLADGLKLGGVLTECGVARGVIRSAVVGIGVNVNLSEARLPEALRGIATSVSARRGRRVSRARLLEAFVVEMDRRYAALKAEGPAALLAEARALIGMAGRIVRVALGDRVVEGSVRGLDEEGALLLRLPSGAVQRVVAWDVTSLEAPYNTA